MAVHSGGFFYGFAQQNPKPLSHRFDPRIMRKRQLAVLFLLRLLFAHQLGLLGQVDFPLEVLVQATIKQHLYGGGGLYIESQTLALWCRIVDAFHTSAINASDDYKLRHLVKVFSLSGELLISWPP